MFKEILQINDNDSKTVSNSDGIHGTIFYFMSTKVLREN